MGEKRKKKIYIHEIYVVKNSIGSFKGEPSECRLLRVNISLDTRYGPRKEVVMKKKERARWQECHGIRSTLYRCPCRELKP